ncbi:MAG TPA: aminodeoxychorismate synthase component I [Rhodanobacteraceae bacterium]|nr:aminodeoxychorismate synthase component I [Rhodanobacteraceae bacterium]
MRREWAGRPDLLALAARDPARYPCLLESVASGTARARWDVLLAFPQQRLLAVDDVATPFLQRLDAAWQAERLPAADDELPFHGGWAVYLAYEMAAEIEPTLTLPSAVGGPPRAIALRCPAALLYDHTRDRTVLVAEAGQGALLEQMQADLVAAAPLLTMPATQWIDEDPAEDFCAAVEQVQRHLAAGDVFQVNLSRRWLAKYAEPPAAAALYAALRRANPAPFAALWQQPELAIASSSPERLLSVRGGVAETRPIAGTRPRLPGDDDAARIRELCSHPKERAEHVMLIDLERNDLGRVCQPGTVEVDELMAVESYAHVHHIVSNVRGRLRSEVTPGQAIAAVFPGGTITGCPKVRCMQIIAALERSRRGAYTGAIGYLDRNGDMDLNILIRTLEIDGREVSLRAGAGIVIDSEPQHELDETRAKARGLLRALGQTA